MDEMDEVRSEFLAESNEGLDLYDQDLVLLEEDPGNSEALAEIFRTVHSIKGLCGFLGYARLEALAHAGESLLVPLRDGIHAVTPEITNVLLAMGDAIRHVLDGIATAGEEPAADHADLIESIRAFGGSAGPAPTQVRPPAPSPAPDAEDSAAPDPVPASNPARMSTRAQDSVRVNVDLLDELVELVGELVLTRNQITESVGERAEPELRAASLRLDHLTENLQTTVLGTRMQPVRSVLSSLPRLVRDLAHSQGKEVQVEISGEDTLLDRALIAAIKDPLVHLVRNAVDHGVESPDERKRAGKPERGLLFVSARQDDGMVVVEVRDDGKGLDLEAIRAKGLERGMLKPNQTATQKELLDLIFAPGFSTAKKVTSVSGRGVGMDVVRTNLARIGGTVRALTEAGRGTTFELIVPLTLAIIPAQLVECAGQTFALPGSSIREVGRLDPGHGDRVEWVQGHAMFRVRGSVYPLLDLRTHLGLPSRDWSGPTYYLLIRSGDSTAGVAVDGISDRVDIVVKRAGGAIDRLDLYTGATVLGDGGIALIVDLATLWKTVPLQTVDTVRPVESSAATEAGLGEAEGSHLVVEYEVGRFLAIPRDIIWRVVLEPEARVQRGPSGYRVPHGEEILPLVDPTFLNPNATESQLEHQGGVWNLVICESQGIRFAVPARRALGFRALTEAGYVEAGTGPRSILLGVDVVDILTETMLRSRVSTEAPVEVLM